MRFSPQHKDSLSICGVVFALAAAITTQTVEAVDVRDIKVSHNDGRYRIFMRVDLATDATAAMDAFTHYPNLTQINPAVKRVDVLNEDGDKARIRTNIKICILWLCKNVNQTQVMHRRGLRLDATVVPNESDLKFGEAKWHVWDCSRDGRERACLTLHADLEPDFWVPPLVGPFVMKRMLAEEARITSRGIEKIANEQ